MFIMMRWQEIVLRASEYLLTRCEWLLQREETRLKGGFPVMAESTRKLAASTRWQFFFVGSTTASTRCLVQNFQLICFSQRVNATSQCNDVVRVRDVQNGRTGWDGCSGETLLAPCTRKKRLQRKMTKHYHWTGVQENTGMFSKS